MKLLTRAIPERFVIVISVLFLRNLEWQFVGCGFAGEGINVQIVSPETLSICGPGNVGEIWISGPSRALGYWGKPELSNAFLFFRSTPDTPSESSASKMISMNRV